MPRGGPRVGAGRPKRSDAERWLRGTAKPPQETATPRPRVPGALLPAPTGLNAAELAVWHATAPLAVEAQTLTPATVDDFVVLCRLEVEMGEVLAERRVEGWSSKGLALAKEYRGLVQRVEAKRRAYRVAAMGKPMVEDVPMAADPFAEFDADTVQ